MRHALRRTFAGVAVAAAIGAGVFVGSDRAHAQAEPLMGQVALFAGNFAPRGWAFCEGQLLPINQYQALFSILGTMYGGDGRTNFALPDLRGRAPIGVGAGPGLANVTQGQQGGAEQVTLSPANMPAHNHDLMAIASPADSGDPDGKMLARSAGAGGGKKGGADIYGLDARGGSATLSGSSIGNAGGGQPVAIRDPYLGLRWIIALQGIYPSRN